MSFRHTPATVASMLDEQDLLLLLADAQDFEGIEAVLKSLSRNFGGLTFLLSVNGDELLGPSVIRRATERERAGKPEAEFYADIPFCERTAEVEAIRTRLAGILYARATIEKAIPDHGSTFDRMASFFIDAEISDSQIDDPTPEEKAETLAWLRGEQFMGALRDDPIGFVERLFPEGEIVMLAPARAYAN